MDNCVKYVVEAAIWGGLDLPFAMSDVVTIGIPGPTPGVATVSAYTPAGMAQEMRMRKSEGDSRIKTANNAPVATSKGPC